MIMKVANRSITSIAASQLTEAQIAAWSRIQNADSTLASAYFRPEFTLAVSSVRNDVEVGVIEEDGEPVGFLPFQRRRFQLGQPVGGRLSDFHGAIVAPGVEWTAAELLAGCGLRAWDFSQLPTSQSQFASSGDQVLSSSSYMDLSEGYAKYESDRRALGSTELKQILRKSRKIERECGNVHFEWQSSDVKQLHQMMEWKSQQYRRTGIADVFSFDWTRRLLETLQQVIDRDFSGVLSTLSVDNKVIALHFGIKSRGVLHYWFPAYDASYEKYSPGVLLVLRMAQSAEENGVTRIELGEGVERYKLNLKTGATEIAAGSFENSNVVRTVRRSWRRTRDWMKTSPLGAPARLSARFIRPLKDWLSFQ